MYANLNVQLVDMNVLWLEQLFTVVVIRPKRDYVKLLETIYPCTTMIRLDIIKPIIFELFKQTRRTEYSRLNFGILSLHVY